MQVLLLNHVKGLGRKGDIKNVKDGYFLNFLQPQKLAIMANSEAIKRAEEGKKKEVIEKDRLKEEAQLVKTKLETLELVLKRKAQGDKLYASITTKDLIDAIFEKLKIRLDKANFSSNLHIKDVGFTEVSVKLNEDVKALIRLEVKAQ